MVDALVGHEGIGLVCGYEDDGAPVCLGKGGKCNLHTGEVTGVDPLKMYAPEDPKAYGHNSIETRVWQVRRVMDFPHAGDLMVLSTVYPDGTVAALEELIGSHGGVGGEQTDAFLFHPRTMDVPEVRNSAEVFGVLNARRGLPVSAEEIAADAETWTPQVDEWSLHNLWAGIKDVGTWIPLALRALVLDRSAYREAANNPRMTGPGLLLGILFSGIATLSFLHDSGRFAFALLTALVSWFVTTTVVYGVGRVLSRRGYYTRTMRTIGFSRVVGVLSLLALIPNAQGVILLLYSAVAFLAFWMAGSEAHEIRGWRSVLLPILAVLLALVTPILLTVLLSSAVVGIESILQQLGLTAG
jgi:hypothetical protein